MDCADWERLKMSDFDRPTLTTIYNRMKADLEQRFGNTNWASRALALIIIAVFGGAIYLCYGFIRRLAKQLFFTTALDSYVKWHGRKYGLPRKNAEFAVGTVRFTGVDTTSIPQYTEVETADGVIFKTDVAAAISGTYVDVAITAAESGADSNVQTSTMSLVTSITDIDDDVSVISYYELEPPFVTQGTNSGVNEETKAEHITRLLQRTQNPPGSGNIADYERWALEISGVGRAWGYDAEDWLGAGTAAVVIASSELEVVASATKTDVETYIATKKPIGASVSVEDPIPKDVELDISISPNTAAFQALINTALTNIFIVTSSPGGTVLKTDLDFAIKGTGIADFDITAITVGGLSISVGDIVSTGLNLSRFKLANYSAL